MQKDGHSVTLKQATWQIPLLSPAKQGHEPRMKSSSEHMILACAPSGYSRTYARWLQCKNQT